MMHTLPSPRAYSLGQSRRYCTRLVHRSGSNFTFAFHLLPREQALAMEALYAFLRLTDDLADEPGPVEVKAQKLSAWRELLQRTVEGESLHPIQPALRRLLQDFGLPVELLHKAIHGVGMDLEPTPLRTFAELYRYCYHVASVVGLACIHVWGYRDQAAQRYAEATGIAFQLTNILRDLGEDLRRGRVYLPQEELAQFDCGADCWGKPEAVDRFHDLMRFQVARAHGYYDQGRILIELLPPPGQALYQVMFRTYRGLLAKIVERNYDVFSERVRLRRRQKLRFLLGALPVRWGWHSSLLRI